jgi:alkanesulfonate monooxygenase SsuD/methylene tetrahydromethanopterin reductase-like flavin-dependent oxidoreductase (luciferase family)
MTTPRGFGINVSLDESIVAASAERAQALGYASFWTNNSPGADGLQVLRVASRVAGTIRLGVGVIPLNHHPVDEIIARSGKGTDDELPMDRLLLGVGASGPGALALARKSVLELREALGCRVYLAALGPKMCRLAGEVADGVLFNWLTPAYARASADLVREGAAAAGRPVPHLMTYIRVAMGSESQDRLHSEAERYEGIPAYGANFQRMGLRAVETAISGDDRASIQEQFRAWDGVLDEVVARSITPNDTLEETLALLEAAAPDRA